MEEKYVVALITASNEREAEEIVKNLLNEKLIACANIVSSLRSLFWWRSKIDEAREHLILAKTRKDLFGMLIEKVKALHSYEVPEIIALPIVEGSRDYLEWLNESLR